MDKITYVKVVAQAENECRELFEKIDQVALANQKKVLDAFKYENLQLSDIASSTGYGNDDRARGKLSAIYAKAFGAESGIVSPLISSGTHALTIALFGILRPNDIMLSVTGKPYDTLLGIIFGNGNGSLADFNVKYDDVELKNNDFDYNLIEKKIKKLNPKMVYVQRSRGYTTRESLSIEKIERLIKFVKNLKKDVVVMVDNCYGEFVELREPCDVGASIAVGSLIKNAGGGIAPTGGYIVGEEKLIELVSSRFIAPNIGLEVGSYAGSYTPFFQGCFLAPHVVANALKGNILFGRVLDKFGVNSFPEFGADLHDIVRTIEFGDADELVKFCGIIQSLSAVDSLAVPEPWDMPGYEDKVVMASGSFVQGSSIELSADGPIRPPYYCYMQGGLTYEHIKLVALEYAKNNMDKLKF